MTAPLIPGRAYDVAFDSGDAPEELKGLIYEDSLDGFYIFREVPSDDPSGYIVSADGIAPAEGERIFIGKSWIKKMRERRGSPVPPAGWIAPPAPAEAVTDVGDPPEEEPA